MFVPIVRALREHTDLDVDLYLDAGNELLTTAFRELRADPPSWAHIARWQHPRTLLAPGRSPIVEELRRYDIVLGCELAPLYAPHTGRPFCFMPSGGDLTVSPFPWRSRRMRSGLRAHASAAAIALWQRRGIRRATEIWAPDFPPFPRAMARLGLPWSRVSDEYFPVAIDPKLYAPRPAGAPEVPLGVPDDHFVVFFPSRLLMDTDPFRVDTGQWKRNEVGIEGFARFVEGVPGRKATLLLIDQRYSPDRDRARRLITELGIDANVHWAVPPGAGFSWAEMRTLYERADVSMDDFGAGWFGSVVVESLAVGTPVVTHVPEETMARLYPWHPIRPAHAPGEVAAALTALHDDPEGRAALGARGPVWVEEFHGPAAIAHRYGSYLERFARERGID